jgi:predicted metal-dependent hydrolase
MPQTDSVSWVSRQEDKSLAALQWLCRSVLQATFPVFRDCSIEAGFYPYIGLTHTIRRKGTAWIVRISDHCRNAPSPVLEAIVMILACKVMHKKPRSKFLRIYELFRKDPLVVNAVRERRLLKGQKRIADDAGKHHMLQDIYREINRRHFDNQIEIEKIGWGIRKSRSRLGHFDPLHHTITLSPVLDSPAVPKYVVSYIVYHEMLHSVFEDTSSRHPRKHHPPEFRRAEKAYPNYAKAKKFLREHYGKRHKISLA